MDEYFEKYLTRLAISGILINGNRSEEWFIAALVNSGMSVDEAMNTVERYYRAELSESVGFYKRILDAVKRFSELDDEEAEKIVSKVREAVISKVIEEKGEDWVVAAMVEESIGYHTPTHARKLIRKFKEGKKQDFCERCLALYNSELDRMIYYDVRAFQRLEERDPERVRQVIEYVKVVERLDPIQQTELGLLYPTYF